jgi:hypothetical protein
MRVLSVFALTLTLAACTAPALVKSAPEPAPYGTPCANPCRVRVVNETAHQLTVLAATPDGTRVLGTVPAGKEAAFGESILAPKYVVTPDAGSSPGAANAEVSCTDSSPRPGEDLLMTCK